MAMPAAAVTACCSAMPTSTKRSGNRASKGSRPVGPGMAAVIATILGSAWAWISSARVKAWVKVVTGRSGVASAPSRESDAFCSVVAGDGASGPSNGTAP